jgi:hypothetical protein
MPLEIVHEGDADAHLAPALFDAGFSVAQNEMVNALLVVAALLEREPNGLLPAI